ncbi:uncharacterized protein PFL1_01630 [Pseudozyma flocculosa PF-1]|uniref:uncharacterized protein n=1 Tax=Pseudozyma flocculosa PF-1 TaxID=1277687 RepID=UPI00045609D3|nr:uncharacterized protein PFL1_01630 [Pseudozyma flocculosa PF-1]EPQ30729.1 hypothetical protein PFL1_01630 [Pseudozyma flocculosa PF-1]
MGLPPRQSLSVPEPPREKLPPAVHPNLLLVVRFLITGLVCLLSLATAIMAILVVDYYNSHDPIIRPSWGSLIFIIILGLLTPIIYFGYNIFLPLMPFIRYGDFLYGLFMVKIELLLQFSMCVLWVSGALAYASDLRGRENCQFDGYLHYPKPDDFSHACDLINYVVPLAYATFGVQVLLWAIETVVGLYIFLFLDQESLNEPHFEWGRRAYNYQKTSQPRSSMIGRPMRASAAGAPAAQSYRNVGRRGPESVSDRSSVTGSGGSPGRRGAQYAEPDMESRASQPVSLGSRGRRGAAYGGIESGWHLKEDESQR